MSETSPTHAEMISFCKYVYWCRDMLRIHDAYIPHLHGLEIKASEFPFNSTVNAMTMFMSYWYGSLYVVVEGWKELGLKDPAIDPLVTSSFVDLLRRCRNGTFHFQPEYFEKRFFEFLEDDDASERWVRILTRSFMMYVDKWIEKELRADQS